MLEGLVKDKKKGPIAYLRNLEDDSVMVVTKEANKKGFHIVSANQATDPTESTVTITDGTETAEIAFDDKVLSRPVASMQPAVPPQGAGGQNQGKSGAGNIPKPKGGQHTEARCSKG